MCTVLRDIAGVLCTRGVDAAIAALAAVQHGIVARWQLRIAGVSDDQIDHRIATGRLHFVYRGVFAVGHPVVSRHGRRMAAVLTYGDDTFFCHMGAAAHWQLVPGARGLDVASRRRLQARDGIQTHWLRLPPDEVTVHEGIPVTTPVRTIFDLAVYGRRTVERAMHEAEHRRLYDSLSLDDLLHRYPRRKGAATVRAILRDPRPQTTGTVNDFEDDFVVFLEQRGFPPPLVNEWLQVGETWIKPDCAWHEQRVIVELDGGTHATSLGRRKDHRRDVAVQAARWRVMRVTWHAFYLSPDEVDADLSRLLKRR